MKTIPTSILQSEYRVPRLHGDGFSVIATEPTQCPVCRTMRYFFILRQTFTPDSTWHFACAVCGPEALHVETARSCATA